MASPALAPLPPPVPIGRYDDATVAAAFEASPAPATSTGTAAPPIAFPRPSPEALARVRRHPYTRLALNGSFTALWAGQLISIFGDRIHQVALAFAVLLTTGSPIASSLVFVAAFVPNLVMSPIAGTLVDRWDRREVLIVSDLLRAAIVLLIPMAIVVNVLLVYPLVFVMTSISIFFRPARAAILPQIVRKDELVTANSALWVGETLGDVVGFPLAALFVAALGTAIPVAFWLDAATYVASALLLSTMVIRAPDPDEEATTSDAAVETGAGQGFVAELKAGYQFLRGEATLFANTIQASVAQLSVGAITALMPTYALVVFGPKEAEATAVYGFLEGATSAGNLVGGFVIGLIGARWAKGRMISVGYALWGLAIALLAMTGNVGVAIGIAFGSGIANMIFVIPSQALFQERTPAALMGRVIGFRFWLVFGSMAIAMAVGGVLSQLIGVTVVLVAFGLISVGAGLAGFLVPAIRDAD
jgi:MFS family permease